MNRDRIELLAYVIADKLDNGEASQVGEAEDHDMSEAEMDAAWERARQIRGESR